MKKTVSVLVLISFINVGDSFAKEYKFNYRYLGMDENADFNFFDSKTTAGNYVVDIYINNELKETAEIYFRNKSNNLIPCLTQENLIKYGFVQKKINELIFDDEQCVNLDKENIKYFFNPTNQILLLNIPSVFLADKNSEIADESLWDDGINALIFNYQANYLRSNNERGGAYFGQIEPGLNLGPWRIRNLSTWKKSKEDTDFESAYIYAERGFNSLKSRLIIGDKYTNTNIFDSISFRGVTYYKDENMIPYSARAYSPKIRGLAKTQAVVEIRQNGYLLYSTSVPPGEFEINSNQFSNFGSGLFDVTVIESNGQNQTYSVPYSIPVISLAKGYSNYSITVGKYRNADIHKNEPIFAEGTYSYGIPYGLSLFGGIQLADIYSSYAVGISKDVGEYGAISFDMKYAKSKPYEESSFINGSAYGIRYNKNFNTTNTDISVANYYYYSKGYRTLSETIDSYNDYGSYNKKSTTSAMLSQPLGALGAINLSYNHDNYWGKNGSSSVVVWYGKNIGSTYLSLSYTRTAFKNYGKNDNEDLFNIMLSIPLQDLTKQEMYANYQMTSSPENKATHDIGLNGMAFDRRMSWQVREQFQEASENKKFSYLNALWNGTYGTFGANYNYSNTRREVGLTLSGGILAHPSGITFGQRISDTAALVEAKGVSGATVLGFPGIKTDFRGYTFSSSLMPYMNNTVSIDPSTLQNNSSIKQTDINVVPTTGAIVKAKYNTSVGVNALIKISNKNGKYLPFGTILAVKDEKGVVQSTSIVGDNGEAYVTGLDGTQEINATWGKEASDSCKVSYSLTEHHSEEQSLTFLNGVCK